MQVRPLRQEEMERYASIIKDAFVLPGDFKETWLSTTKPEDTRGLFDEQGHLIAGMRLLWNELWLGQRPVKPAGVTSVATPPEFRRKGHLKQLLTTVMTELRESGINITTLYPFEFAFYRKFGYELASATAEINVKIPAMAHFKSKAHGEWEQVGPNDWPELNSLYQQYSVGRFGRLERPTEFWWMRQLLTPRIDGNKKEMTIYRWRDEKGRVRAYVIYYMKILQNQWDREMSIREMVWLDEDARYEIYSFIANHDSQASAATWETEPGDEFFALMQDPRSAKISTHPGYMLRLLDVERALGERAWPALEQGQGGSFSLAVRDNVLHWNHDRTYRMEVRPGSETESQVEITAIAGSAHAGLSCDVRTLAQMYAGYLSPKQAARLRLLEVHNSHELDLAQRIFSPPGQPGAFMNDFW
ncbi:MAG TPA: GNAT family N-acetyltransferase [Chloroflexia bacterium]|nr:GNAT family N-acetyltransferase [Chloroflexia bacterium]